ncbi:hypothetical protein UPYG_G00352770 [Umbra pygmaea]|uniref:Uncharacterized protein n=1 Tax=Umbra pygmaea TaxID=75934 RepID=A0ABD0VVY6_UMBPY
MTNLDTPSSFIKVMAGLSTTSSEMSDERVMVTVPREYVGVCCVSARFVSSVSPDLWRNLVLTFRNRCDRHVCVGLQVKPFLL